MKRKSKLSRQHSDRIYSGFLKWRESLLNLEEAIIVVEGKRDLEVLDEIGVTKFNSSLKIVLYSQLSLTDFTEYIQSLTNRIIPIIPLVDFDEKGEEYLKELKQFKTCDVELRNNLYGLTNGRLIEFEDLFKYLRKSLYPLYYNNLQEVMQEHYFL